MSQYIFFKKNKVNKSIVNLIKRLINFYKNFKTDHKIFLVYLPYETGNH